MLEVADVENGQIHVHVPEVPNAVCQFLMACLTDRLLIANSQPSIQRASGDGVGVLVVNLVIFDLRLGDLQRVLTVDDGEVDRLTLLNDAYTFFGKIRDFNQLGFIGEKIDIIIIKEKFNSKQSQS